jgi:5-methylcytosine-specific restriction endonuclease McrA
MIRLEQRGAVAFTCMAIAVVVILPTNLRALLRAHIGLPCPYCTKPMLKPTRDHIRPVRYGGSLTDQNKVIVCEPCNHDRGHHTLTDWARHLRRDGDPRAATVTAFRAARKAAKAEADRRM